MKTLLKIFVISFIGVFITASKLYSINLQSNPGDCDSLQLLTKYSLFSEYHKNKDYISALPYGWQVLECNPDKFRKWIYYKMEDALWYVHDSTEVSDEMAASLNDTMIYVYDMAMEHYPEEKAYFQSHKAFVYETWFDEPSDVAIAEYEKAIEMDKNLSSYYYDRLGELYLKNMTDENGFEAKAIDIYAYLQEREPDNPLWVEKLSKIVKDPSELVRLKKKNWMNNQDNLTKAWDFASTAMRFEMYEDAIEGLEFLVSKSPETVNYWNQLATAYQKLNMLTKAEDALLKLIDIDPTAKEHYFNLGIVYSDKGNYSKARRYYVLASEKGGGWALPIFYEGYLYEKAAKDCSNDFDSKVVYQVALDTYKKAKRLDPNLQQAINRINALSTSVPTQEDYFFRGYKSGDVINVSDGCPGWIGESITVP